MKVCGFTRLVYHSVWPYTGSDVIRIPTMTSRDVIRTSTMTSIVWVWVCDTSLLTTSISSSQHFWLRSSLCNILEVPVLLGGFIYLLWETIDSLLSFGSTAKRTYILPCSLLEYRNSLEYRKIGLRRFFPVFGSGSVSVSQARRRGVDGIEFLPLETLTIFRGRF